MALFSLTPPFMKQNLKRIILCLLLFAHGAVAQTGVASLVFTWDGQSRGLFFSGTNLTDAVKNAIRDDIALVMANVAPSNTELIVFDSGNPSHNMADGLLNIPLKGKICPVNFPLGYYRTVNGMLSFALSDTDCEIYASAVALTNQYVAQIAELPAKLIPFTNGFDIAGMTLAQKKAYIWNPELEKQETDDIVQFEADISDALPKETNWATFFQPSVLSYRLENFEDGGDVFLTCAFNTRLNRPANPTMRTLIFAYKGGAWRWCPEIL
jgi:hypothetical protein